MDVFEQIAKDVQEGKREAVKTGVQKALDDGMAADDILKKGLIAGMDVVAKRFKTGQMFLPEVMPVASAMKNGLALIQPHLEKSDVKPIGIVVMGTVRGDMHDIGKNLVVIMLQGAGFKVIDLGVNVLPGAFVEAVRKEKPDVVGMSALLTTTMVHMRGVIEALEKNGLREGVKIIVGGAPISKKFCDEIKADGYGRDAAMAVDLVKELIDGRAE